MRPEEDLRQRAAHYREMARSIDDALAHKALLNLADEYEAQAEATQGDGKPDGDDGDERRGSR